MYWRIVLAVVASLLIVQQADARRVALVAWVACGGLTVARETYETAAEAEADRTQQKALLAALGGWDRALRRDECGAWRIEGKRGSAYTWGGGKTWVLFVACRSALHWTHTKRRRLSFCMVTQDGEEEGCLRLHMLPTPEQAAVIRDALGIHKHREVSTAVRERLQAFAFGRSTRSEAGPSPHAAISDPAAPLP
jgi:hypothetical protein